MAERIIIIGEFFFQNISFILFIAALRTAENLHCGLRTTHLPQPESAHWPIMSIVKGFNDDRLDPRIRGLLKNMAGMEAKVYANCALC